MLQKIREELFQYLTPAEALKPQLGFETGVSSLDDFLLWKGLPAGELTSFVNQPGQGGTSLWIRTCENILKQGKKVAWVCGTHSWLQPEHLKRRNIDLEKLFIVRTKNETSQKKSSQAFWILQELISSTLFEMVGFQVSGKFNLKASELQKLKQLAKAYKVALVILTTRLPSSFTNLFSLIIDFAQGNLHIRRALHRPTPFLINSKEVLLANPMLELSSSHERLVG